MYCDRSAYYQKAIKATARQLKNKHVLAVAFFAFWALTNTALKRFYMFFLNQQLSFQVE